jgi:hypothetical protein
MYMAAFREIDMKLGGSVPSSQQLADSLQTVLSSVLDAELCTSDTGVAVPTRWKWRLLKDVDDIEDAQEQQSSGCIAYRMWMALSVDMAPETVADNCEPDVLRNVCVSAGLTKLYGHRCRPRVEAQNISGWPFQCTGGIASLASGRCGHCGPGDTGARMERPAHTFMNYAHLHDMCDLVRFVRSEGNS